MRCLFHVEGNLTNWWNEPLTSRKGHNKLKFVDGSLNIYAYHLDNLKGLGNLKSLRGIRGMGATLKSLEGLAKIQFIEKIDTVLDGEVESFKGLHNLKHITGDLAFFIRNPKGASFEGLEKLTYV